MRSNPARREATRRFAIVVAAFVLMVAAWTMACYLVTQLVAVAVVAAFGALLVAGWIGIYWFVFSMRSICPKCGERSARLVRQPAGEIYLACNCGYSEPTGWGPSNS